MRISYYAIFNYDEYDKCEEKYGISITFPDIPEANTCARSDKEGLDMALEVLQLVLVNNDGKPIAENNLPNHTPLEQIKLEENEKAFLIEYDTKDIDISKFQFYQ